MPKSGFIKINRKLFEHELFLEHREFSRFEAWLDLIQICAFEENNTMIFKGRIVKWGRGQTIASVRYLQQRWNWKSTKKVFSYLELLRSQKMIETDKTQGLQRITLCKYESYNSSGNTGETEMGTPGKQSGNKIKELKELKNKREARAQTFYESVFSFSDKYPQEMLKKFFDYWTEPNKSGTKMKFEMEKTWDVSRRLNTWAGREKEFTKREPGKSFVQSLPKIIV